MIGTTLKEYNIKSQIGQGGMATVYLAEDRKFHTNVAIKVLSKEMYSHENIRNRFIAEARSMFRMSHPHIVKVTDLIDQDGMVAFVMEHVDGVTLKEYMDVNGPFGKELLSKVFLQMLDAIGYVHEQGVIHRDVKPSNFMITSKGQIKLMDFGIAKIMDATASEYTSTGTSQQMGTPMYMSPEQVKSTKAVTSSTDIYSLGVVLWQMISGRRPYESTTISTFEMQTKIVNEPLPSTGTQWDSIISKSTHKIPEERYTDISEFKKAFVQVASAGSSATPVAPQPSSSPSPTSAGMSLEEWMMARKRPHTNTAVNIVSVIACCIIIGVLSYLNVQNGYEEYEEDSSLITEAPSSVDDAAVVEPPAVPEPVDGFEAEEATPAPEADETFTPTQYSTVEFVNASSDQVSVAVGYRGASGWESHGWYNIKPGESYFYNLPSGFTEDLIYWYAEDVFGNKYEGKDNYLCVKEEAFSFYGDDHNNCDRAPGFYELRLSGQNTVQRLID